MKQCKQFLAVLMSAVFILGIPVAAFAGPDLTLQEAQNEMAGYVLVVYDTVTQAVSIENQDFIFDQYQRPVDRYIDFCAADGRVLGTTQMSYFNANHATFRAAPEHYTVRYEDYAINAFNVYRGVAPYDFEGAEAARIAAQQAAYAEEVAARSQTQRVDAQTLESYAYEVYERVNEERANEGLPEVYWDDGFAMCADIRAQEMSIKFGHERPYPEHTGRNWPANASGNGIYNAPSVADEQGVAYDWVMENAGMGYRNPERVVSGWMNSSGHRANILKDDHTRCGVGVYQADDGTLYWALWLD